MSHDGWFTPRALRRSVALAALATLSASVAPAAAQSTAPPTPASLSSRTATLTLDDKLVRISVNFRDVVDAEISKKLLSGLRR